MTPERTRRNAQGNARASHGSRARAKREARGPSAAQMKEQRVRHCMVLMARGAWIPGITSGSLRKKWGVAEATMEAYAGEASRRIRTGVLLDEDLRAAVLATLQGCASSADQIARSALKGKRKQLRAATEAIRVKVDATKALAGVAGVEAAKKVEVGGTLSDLFGLVHDGKTGDSEK